MLVPEDSAWLTYEIEHIRSEKHNRLTVAENLAFACPDCNGYKGTDLGSIDDETGVLTPFYNPRTQNWNEHFYIDNGWIRPLTATGRVTVTILKFNLPNRVDERRNLLPVGQYP